MTRQGLTAARNIAAWAPEDRNGDTHYRMLVMALLPAAAILATAATVLTRLLAG